MSGLRTVWTSHNGVHSVRTLCSACGDTLRDVDHWREHRRCHMLEWWWARYPETMRMTVRMMEVRQERAAEAEVRN